MFNAFLTFTYLSKLASTAITPNKRGYIKELRQSFGTRLTYLNNIIIKHKLNVKENIEKH